ncbi:MAG: patatin-like phospholipase family protein [Clostridia bacterium]|nr:patatin-like phospholipase family protein [Clostridia bacterium]
MKRALVLSGGGARGAYELGAWQALDEIGIAFHAVYGTSIGAINAGLFAQGDLQKAKALWSDISMKKIVATNEEEFSIDFNFSSKHDILPFLLDNLNHLRMDITPLETKVHDNIDEGRLRASGMTLGIMAVTLPQFTPVPMRLSDMAEGSAADWLIASASCYPIFQPKWIGRQRYIDGGYFDNLPLDMAIEDGADEIVAIDIHPVPAHAEYAQMPFLKLIHPRKTLSGFLNFKQELLDRMRRMGYYDTMKAYDRLEGIRYTFQREDALKTALPAERYLRAVARFDAESIKRRVFHAGQVQRAPLITALCQETPERALTRREVWLRGMELCAERMGFREDAIYLPEELTRRMLNYVRQTSPDVSPIVAPEALQALGSRALIRAMVHTISERGSIPPELVNAFAAYPEETAAALWLCCAEGKSA